MEQIYTPKHDYKVLVRCFTYNQSGYIEDALNGFAMQQTNFPFVCLVMDDCSTDGEQDVIKAWMERECDMSKAEYIDLELSSLILVTHKTNPNCSFGFYFLKQNLWGKGGKMPLVKPWRESCQYEALCEGDDYWLDKDKLQKQTDILDQNPDYTMVLSDGLIGADACKAKRIYPYGKYPTGTLDMHTLLQSRGGLVPTASMLYRLSVEKNRPEELYCQSVGDKPLRMWCAINGGVFYSDAPMVFYRFNAVNSFNRSVNSNTERARYVYDSYCQYLDRFDSYTSHKYHEDVLYMKAKEEFAYLQRIKSKDAHNCEFLNKYERNLTLKIKTFLACNMPWAFNILRCLKNTKIVHLFIFD